MLSAPLLLLGLRLVVAAPDTSRPAAAPALRRVEAAIREYQARGHIPAVSAAIARNGKLIWARSFGYADLENRVRATELTVFPTASVLKTITAVAVLQLSERGRLDLDAPIQSYCPAFPPKRWPVTARLLLLHQAGVRASSGKDVFNREHFSSVGHAVRRFADDSLRFEPGSAVLYSNEGYVLLACAIEGASGESYDAWLHRAILGPAGMRNTFPEDVYRVMPHLARSYLVRTAENTRMWEGLWTPAHLAATTLDVPAPNVQFNQPAELMRRILELLDPP